MKGSDPDDLKFSWDEDNHTYKNNKTEGYDEIIKRGFEYFHTYNIRSYHDFLSEVATYYKSRRKIIKDHIKSTYPFWDMHVYETLQNDLMEFFNTIYQTEDFFQALGFTPQVECFEDYIETHKKEMEQERKKYSWKENYSNLDFYEDYQIIQLMSYFKDIMVMYLGYDSIERRLTLDSSSFTKYKSITTSCTNPNEKFYNWLLMDWNVQRIPRMMWNEQEKRFIRENPILPYYQTEKEEILGKEIQSIQKEIPKQYRKEYFRK